MRVNTQSPEDAMRAILRGCTHHFQDEPVLDAALEAARAEGRRGAVRETKERLARLIIGKGWESLKAAEVRTVLDEVAALDASASPPTPDELYVEPPSPKVWEGLPASRPHLELDEIDRSGSAIDTITVDTSENGWDDQGRWSRGGWHTRPCWEQWVMDPESGCICKPRD